MLDRHLQQLVTDLRLDPIPPADEQKQRHLKLDKLLVSMRDLDPGIFFSSLLPPVPKQKKEELFIFLMKANFLGQGTGGGALGLMEDESFLTLSLALPYDVNYRLFKETLEEFTNFAEYWQKEIAKFPEVLK